MSRLVPIQIPMEVATMLSAEEAIGRLRTATRRPRGFSIMAHRAIVGTISFNRVVLRRGTIAGWDLSRNCGEFQGNFVAQGGSVKLRGKFVEIARAGRGFVIALAAALISTISYMWISYRRGGEVDWSSSAFDATIVLLTLFVFALLLRPSSGERRSTALAEAELLANDIERVLND